MSRHRKYFEANETESLYSRNIECMGDRQLVGGAFYVSDNLREKISEIISDCDAEKNYTTVELTGAEREIINKLNQQSYVRQDNE